MTAVPVLAYGEGHRPALGRGWVALGIAGVVVSLAVMLFNGGLCVLGGRMVWMTGGRTVTATPASPPLTAATADGIVAALPAPPALTPAQRAAVSRRLQAAGQCYCPINHGSGGFRATDNGDGTVDVSGWDGSRSARLTLDAAGHVRREMLRSMDDDGTTTVATDAAGRTTTTVAPFFRSGHRARLASAAAVVAAAAADVVVGGWLMAVAFQMLRRSPVAVARARRWAVVDLAAVAAFTAALLWSMIASGTPGPLTATSPALLAPAGIAVFAVAYPLAVLIAAHRHGRTADRLRPAV